MLVVDLSNKATRDPVLVASVKILSNDVETVTIAVYTRTEEGNMSITTCILLQFSDRYQYQARTQDVYHVFVQCSQTFSNIKTLHRSL